MTNNFHYIFKAPLELEEVLKSKDKSYLNASFNNFHINNDNTITGICSIYIKHFNKKNLYKETIRKLENSLLNGNEFKRFSLEGKRYSAKGLQLKKPQFMLNRDYQINIKEDLSTGEKAIRIPLTPITLVGDTLFAGAAILVILPIMALAAE